MVEITLHKALSVKKQLQSQLQTLQQQLYKYSRVQEGEDKVYDGNDLYNEYCSVQQKLIQVKTLIAEKNLAINEIIFTIAELKSLCKILQSINLESSETMRTQTDKFVIKYDPFVSIVERDKLIKEYQKQINDYQDNINEYNYNTKIQLPFDL